MADLRVHGADSCPFLGVHGPQSGPYSLSDHIFDLHSPLVIHFGHSDLLPLWPQALVQLFPLLTDASLLHYISSLLKGHWFVFQLCPAQGAFEINRTECVACFNIPTYPAWQEAASVCMEERPWCWQQLGWR